MIFGLSNLELAGWIFVILMGLIFSRIPIGLAMLICGVVGNYLINGSWIPILSQLKFMPFETFSNYSLSIVPLFLLMGQFATRGGMSKALFKAAEAWMGHLKGGVGMAAVGACGGFGAICGSSLATAATMGQVALPEMKRYGYSDSLATGILAAGGTLGILIPPSVVLVIYAILAEQNIAKLFVAAFIPGILAALGYIIAIAIYVRLKPGSAGQREAADFTERLRALRDVWPVMMVFIAVVGGIYAGVFTPTEAAAIGACGTALIAIFNGGMNLSSFVDSLLETAVSTGMIFFIILGASVFNTFLGFAQLPQEVASWAGNSGYSPWMLLLLVLLCYLVFGCIMDSLSMILLTVPIFFPMMAALDFGLTGEEFALWFGILVLVVVEVGLITPPVGMNLFVINSMADDVPMVETYRGVVPFIMSDIVRIGILVVFPSISLVMVRLLF